MGHHFDFINLNKIVIIGAPEKEKNVFQNVLPLLFSVISVTAGIGAKIIEVFELVHKADMKLQLKTSFLFFGCQNDVMKQSSETATSSKEILHVRHWQLHNRVIIPLWSSTTFWLT